MKKEIRLEKVLIVVVIISIAVVVFTIAARMILVPSFTSVNGDYRYQWHRVTNEQEWKDFTVKYKGDSYCKDCHSGQIVKLAASVHAKIQCENCHGAAFNHPEQPKKLTIERGRGLCLRCHSSLPYRPAKYIELPVEEIRPKPISMLKMINPDDHNPDAECVACHDPHRGEFK